MDWTACQQLQCTLQADHNAQRPLRRQCGAGHACMSDAGRQSSCNPVCMNTKACMCDAASGWQPGQLLIPLLP